MGGNLDCYETKLVWLENIVLQQANRYHFYCSLRGASIADHIAHTITRRVIFAKHKVLIWLTLKGGLVLLIRPRLPADAWPLRKDCTPQSRQ